MGALSGADFAQFSAIAEVAMWWSFATPPVVLASGAMITARRGPVWLHGVGLLAEVI